MILPDYSRSVLNVACAVLSLFGARPPHAALPEIASAPRKSHVALVILDGLGEAQLKLLPEGAFLRRQRLCTLTSVCPSTTTAATTSLYSALSPAEHGWLGWSCYVKEYARMVDLFPGRDSYSKRRLNESPAWALMPFVSVFDRIRRGTGGRALTRAVFPFKPGALSGMDAFLLARTLDEAAAAILAADGQDAFTLFYWPEPDETMHMQGAFGERAAREVEGLDAWAEALAGKLRDTTLIVTADHGLTDVSETVFFNDRPELMRCLIMPPSVEPRAASLFVKRGREREFERAFEDALGADFLLMAREEALARALFGPGMLHEKADDFLGNYMALAKGAKAIRYRPVGGAPYPKMIGQHAGLTEAEMLVPLILYG